MWLSEQKSRKPATEATAEWGAVTIGEPAAVYLAGERRQVPICCPGGYAWRPAVGERVLVITAGNEGESPYILGKTQHGEETLQPGQTRIAGGDCSILLGEMLQMTGEVRINGEEIQSLVRRVVGEMLGLSEKEEKEEEGT